MDKLVEKIAEIIHIDKHERHHIARDIIQAILSDPSIVKIGPDAELPATPYDFHNDFYRWAAYRRAQQDMAGWVKPK